MSNEQTPAPTTTPQESLALRYSYDELRAPYKGYADQVAALMKAYGDILAIQDPAQRQGALDQLKSWVSGTAPTREQLSTVTGPLADAARALGLGVGMDAASGVAGAVTGTVRVAGAVGNGLMLPVDFAKGILGFASDVQNEGWNTQLSEAQAREIGAAYGSVLQAQSENRGGMFASFGNVWAYTRAAFATAWDFVRPLLAQLPWVGQYFDGQAPARSFDEHLQRALVDTDMGIVRDEFAKVPSIGGIDGARLGEFLSRGGVAQDAAGNNMNIAAPSSENPTPNAPAAPTDANGNPIGADASVTGTAGDAIRRAGNGFTQRMGERLSGIDTPEEVVGAGLGAVGTVQLARGATESLARRHVVKPAERAQGAASSASQRVDDLEARLARAEAGERRSFFRRPESPEAVRSELERAQQRFEHAQTRADRFGAPDERVGNLRGSSHATVRAMGAVADQAGESLNWKNPFNWPRMAGRGIGNAFGFVTEPVASRVVESAGNDVRTAREAFNNLRGHGAAPAAAAAAETVDATADVAQAASRTGMLGRLSSGLGKLRSVPYIGRGLAGLGGALGFLGVAGLVATPATAAVETATAENGLVRSVSAANTTALTATSLSALKIGVLRAGAFIAPVYHTGELGVAIARDDERTQNRAGVQLATIGTFAAGGAGLGMLGGPFAPLTVPAGAIGGTIVGGIVSIFSGMWAEKRYDRAHPQATQVAATDGAAGPADRGLQVAAVQQTQRAREAAANAALAFRSGNVMQGAVLRNEDGSLQSLRFGANGQEIGARSNA